MSEYSPFRRVHAIADGAARARPHQPREGRRARRGAAGGAAEDEVVEVDVGAGDGEVEHG